MGRLVSIDFMYFNIVLVKVLWIFALGMQTLGANMELFLHTLLDLKDTAAGCTKEVSSSYRVQFGLNMLLPLLTAASSWLNNL